MEHKLSYYFSKEYLEKVNKDKCDEIRNHLNNLDIQYNQYRKIEFHNQDELKKGNKLVGVGLIFILAYIFIFGTVFYFILKDEIGFQFSVFIGIFLIVACLLVLGVICSRKSEVKKTIKGIELDDSILRLTFLDGKEAIFNFHDVSISSIAMRDKDSNVSSNTYFFKITEPESKKRKVFYVNTVGVLYEYLAFYIYLGYVKNGEKYEGLEDNHVLLMVNETTYGKKEDFERNNCRAFLIMGIVFLFLIGACFFNIGMRLAHLGPLDKVEAQVTDVYEQSYFNSDLQRVKKVDVTISYEYKGTQYDKRLFNTQQFGTKVGKKVNIYVYPDQPEYFDSFRVGLEEISIIGGFAILAYVCLFFYTKKKKELGIKKEKKDF